jgi:hypothetical protein
VRPSPELRADDRPGVGPETLDLADLSVGELLVIWALRMRLARGPSGPVTGFRLAFGLAGLEAALASFESLFRLLERHCRCDIGLHAPGCRCVSADEMTVVGVIAALQAGAPRHAHLMGARLIEAAVLDGFLDHAQRLAASLTEGRLHLPLRPRPCCDGGRAPAIH